jgi:ATP-dependent helicase/nuclease subunit A
MERPMPGATPELLTAEITPDSGNINMSDRVVDLSTHEIVRAGAGAGKTYTLTHKVMAIADAHLKESGRLPRVVVTTFTRKATQELRERLMVLALEEKPHLVDFINSRSQLVVSTIHGVLDLYLKRYGASIGLDPGYQIVAGDEAGKLARQTLRGLIFSEPEAQELLESFAFNQLVSLVRRIDALMVENPDAHPFSLSDFEALFAARAAKLAGDLEEAGARIKEESTQETWLAMADEYFRLASILRKGGWVENRARFADVLANMKTGKRNKKSPPVDDSTADLAEEVRDQAKDLAKEPVFDPEVWRAFTAVYEKLEVLTRRFSTAFRKAKRERGQLEISDLELLAMECARRFPETAEAFSRDWDHWLIDEYQDTSPFQVRLLRTLAGDRPNFIVGDPQQSIYLFRGARSEVFGEKEKEILGGGGKQSLLKMNRRSRPEMLLFINDFFSRLRPAFNPMEPFFKDGAALDPSRVVATYFVASDGAKDASSVSEEQLAIDVEAKDSRTAAGARVGVSAGAPEATDAAISPEHDDPELAAIAAHIQSLIAAGAKNEDICVLGRTNRTLIDVAEYLARHRLPTHVHAASGFYDRRETRDAIALLKFLVNPYDNVNLVELLRSPWFRMPDGTLAEITLTRPEALWEKLLSENSASEEFKAVYRLKALLERTQTDGFSEAFKRGLIDAGFVDLSHTQDVSGRRESNIWKLLSQLQQEEAQPGFNPIAFVNGRSNALRLDEGNAEGDAVAAVEPDRINLMTIHASKGLEFAHVILPRMQQKPNLTVKEDFTYDEDRGKWALRVPYGEDRTPLRSLPEEMWLERFQVQELREHARVLYVALTRAIDSVFMSWTGIPATNSWADMAQLRESPGLHRTESYSFVVQDEVPRVEAKAREEKPIPPPPAKWREPAPLAPHADHSIRTDLKGQAVSVTDLMDRKVGVHVESTAQPDVVRRIKTASTGTAVHRLMELMKYPSRAWTLPGLVKKWFPDQEEKVLAAIEFVIAAEDPPIAQIIRNGAVEWGFAFKENGIVIEGQVDLWGRTDAGGFWIVDYKTGNPEFKQKAFDQMALYALALRRSGLVAADEPIHFAAVYPFAKEIYTDREPPREKLKELFGV